MLPKKERLARRDFDPVIKGKSYPSLSFTLRIAVQQKNGSIKPKFSVVVSKKVAKKAVDRNKITRRTYEALRIAGKNTPLPPLSAAAFMKSASISVSLKDLAAEFGEIFKKLQ